MEPTREERIKFINEVNNDMKFPSADLDTLSDAELEAFLLMPQNKEEE